jgi:multidrug transporter EmrE-like cation transporter
MALVIFATIIGSFGPIFLKRSSGEFSLNPFKMIRNINLIIGISFYVLSTVFFIIALKNGELSVLYPFVSTVYIFVSFLSIIMLKEKMNTLKWAGIISIIAGVVFIGLGA